MVIKGALAAAVLPLGITAGGILAEVEQARQDAAARYVQTCHDVRESLLIRAPETAPRSAGEIGCWQRSDASIRESQIFSDSRGDIYLQDSRGRLRVLRLEPGFRLRGNTETDWMSERLIDAAEPAGSFF